MSLALPIQTSEIRSLKRNECDEPVAGRYRQMQTRKQGERLVPNAFEEVAFEVNEIDT